MFTTETEAYVITKVYVLNMLEKEKEIKQSWLTAYLEKETTEYPIHACLVCGDYMYFVTGQPSKLYYSTNPVPSLHMRHTVSQSPSTGRMERYEQTMQRAEKNSVDIREVPSTYFPALKLNQLIQ
ncbi:uncharacterized protein LOC144452094 [Glandiceps talaboti]